MEFNVIYISWTSVFDVSVLTKSKIEEEIIVFLLIWFNNSVKQKGPT